MSPRPIILQTNVSLSVTFHAIQRIMYMYLYILCSRMFSYGEFKAEDQERMLAALNKRVEGVYRVCIGDNEANIR